MAFIPSCIGPSFAPLLSLLPTFHIRPFFTLPKSIDSQSSWPAHRVTCDELALRITISRNSGTSRAGDGSLTCWWSECRFFTSSTNDSNSPTLSGAQASSTQSNSSKPDLRHYEMYRSSAIVKQWTDREGTSLKTQEDCRMAMVWIALLGGGDYAPEGLTGFGESHKSW